MKLECALEVLKMFLNCIVKIYDGPISLLEKKIEESNIFAPQVLTVGGIPFGCRATKDGLLGV